MYFSKVFKQNIKPNYISDKAYKMQFKQCVFTSEEEGKILQHIIVAICSTSDQLVHFFKPYSYRPAFGICMCSLCLFCLVQYLFFPRLSNWLYPGLAQLVLDKSAVILCQICKKMDGKCTNGSESQNYDLII